LRKAAAVADGDGWTAMTALIALSKDFIAGAALFVGAALAATL
jgi:hypothetical protein